MEPNTLCCGRSWSIASTTPVDPCYPRPGARWERSPSSKTPGATFQQPSRPSGSSGCLYASSAVRRPSAPSPWLRGPLVPFTIVLRLTPLSSGQEDRQLDVCWLELLPKIIVDSAERAIDLSSCGTSTMHGFGTPRHKACCPFRNDRCGRPPFSWSVR